MMNIKDHLENKTSFDAFNYKVVISSFKLKISMLCQNCLTKKAAVLVIISELDGVSWDYYLPYLRYRVCDDCYYLTVFLHSIGFKDRNYL